MLEEIVEGFMRNSVWHARFVHERKQRFLEAVQNRDALFGLACQDLR